MEKDEQEKMKIYSVLHDEGTILRMFIDKDIEGKELEDCKAILEFLDMLTMEGGLDSLMLIIYELIEKEIIQLKSTKTGLTVEQTKRIQQKIGTDPMIL